MCIALYTRCFPSVCGKKFTGDSGAIRTHDLLLTSADVLTARPPSLPVDDRPARILCSSRFCDLMKTDFAKGFAKGCLNTIFPKENQASCKTNVDLLNGILLVSIIS